MKHKSLFLITLFSSFAMYAMEEENEWIGIEKYWLHRDRETSIIYNYCSHHKKDRYCAIINAHLLTLAQEKQETERLIKCSEDRIYDVERDIAKYHCADFITQRRLQRQKALHMKHKEEYQKKLPLIIAQQLISTNELEHAFDQIVISKNKECIELDMLERAERKAHNQKIYF